METKLFRIYDKHSDVYETIENHDPWTLNAEQRKALFNSHFLNLRQVVEMPLEDLTPKILKPKFDANMFIQVKRTNFKRHGADLCLLQIIDVSNSVAMDKKTAHQEFERSINLKSHEKITSPL